MSGYSALPNDSDDVEKAHTSGGKGSKDADTYHIAPHLLVTQRPISSSHAAESSAAMGYPVQAAPYSPSTFAVPQGVSPTSPLGVWLEGDLLGCFNDMNVCCYGLWCMPCAFASNNVRISPMWESLPPGARATLSVPINGLYAKAFCLLCLPGLVNSWMAPLLVPGVQVGLLSLLTCGALAYVGSEFRGRLRRKYQLPERALGVDGCPDFAVYCCCTPCAICQEARELKRRGL